MPEHPGVAVISALELERENLSSRLQKVDAAIVAMRELFHLPQPPAKSNGHAPRPPKRVKATTTPATTGKSAKVADAIREALRRGPISPGALAEALDMPVANVSYHVKKLEAQGVVRTSGTSNSRRVALADGSAKEEP